MTFHGLKLELPPELPGSFAFDFAEVSAKEEAGENAAGAAYRLVVDVIGEEQYRKVRDHIAKTGKPGTLVDLTVAIIRAFGLDEGEAPASAGS